MERKYQIGTHDGSTIYGTLNFLKENNTKLAIFVHGLNGNQTGHL